MMLSVSEKTLTLDDKSFVLGVCGASRLSAVERAAAGVVATCLPCRKMSGDTEEKQQTRYLQQNTVLEILGTWERIARLPAVGELGGDKNILENVFHDVGDHALLLEAAMNLEADDQGPR